MIRFSALIAAAILSAAAPALAAPGDRAIEDIRILSADDMQGRAPGTPGSEKARSYIVSRFARIGLSPIGDTFEQPFEFAKRDGTKLRGVNLVARIKGTRPGKAMVVSAHYDHLGVRNGEIYNGADDNASGVAGLLAVAEAFKAKRPKHDVIFAVVDAEESGLRGAKAFAAAPPVPLESIALDVNFDMLSKNAKNELYVSGASPFPFLKPILVKVAATAKVTLKLGHDTDADGKLTAEEMIRQLVAGQEAVVKTARGIFPLVDKVGDEPTADLLTQRMQIHEKNAWMLRSLLEE